MVEITYECMECKAVIEFSGPAIPDGTPHCDECAGKMKAIAVKGLQ